jgi:Family of unknown function (DUF6328)
MNPNEGRTEEEARSDKLLENYRSILNEFSLLTTVSVLLFGFLLTSSSIATSDVEQWTYTVAVVLVATATLIFVLPVAYHHLQFPYYDFAKFRLRAHNWIRIGLPLLGASFYLTLVLSISSIFHELSVGIAAIPLLATAVAFFVRKLD